MRRFLSSAITFSRPIAQSSLAVLLLVGCAVTSPDGGGDGDGDNGVGWGAQSNSGGASLSTGGTGGGVVGVGGTGGGGIGSGGGLLGTGGTPVQDGPSHVVFVAHQDDDLLFINPELKHALDRNEALTTVYLTSGNAGLGMDYVNERELGIRSAYAHMAGEANSWNCALATYGTKSVQECIFSGSADLRLLFLRLVDGFADGSSTNSLMKLWTGASASSSAVDGSGLTFTRAEMVETLGDVLLKRGATEIYTTDYTFRNRQNDHSDHEYAALFALAASSTFNYPHGLHSHITYSTTDWPSNLSEADTGIVASAFGYYASCDQNIAGCSGGVGCDNNTCSTSSALYTSWFSRFYKDARHSPPMSGALTNSAGGGCIGAGAVLVSCASALSLSWNADFTLTGPDGQCLTAPALGGSQDLFFSACTGSDHQKWFHLDNGFVMLGAAPAAGDNGGYNLAKCLTTSGGMGAAARVSDCGPGGQVEWYF